VSEKFARIFAGPNGRPILQSSSTVKSSTKASPLISSFLKIHSNAVELVEDSEMGEGICRTDQMQS
ncbi:10876_t:CDS:2, partial [Funneliformis geosporum]